LAAIISIGGGTRVDLMNQIVRFENTLNIFTGGVGGEFLIQGHGDGILRRGPPHLGDIGRPVKLSFSLTHRICTP